jgi:DNA-binding MarR family transcriptional regulator
MEARGLGETAELLARVGRAIVGDGHAEGLKPVQWEALRYLARANRFSRTPGALAAYLGSTKGTVSQTLTTLERKGLVAKREGDRDRRSVRLAVSEAGDRLLARDPLRHARAVLDALDDALREELGRGLEAWLRARIARRGGRAFGVCHTCRHFRADHPGGEPHLCALLIEPLAEPETELICVEYESH